MARNRSGRDRDKDKGRGSIITVDILTDNYESLKRKTESNHFTVKEFLNKIIKMHFEKEEFLNTVTPHLSFLGCDGDTINLLDTKRKEMIEVRMNHGRLVCGKDKTTDCQHVWYAWAIPELTCLEPVYRKTHESNRDNESIEIKTSTKHNIGSGGGLTTLLIPLLMGKVFVAIVFAQMLMIQ